MLKCVLGWCLPINYQKLESPRPDSPVHVDINVEILDILSVNDKEFSISMSMYFSVMWQESRIWTNNTIEPGFWYPVSLEFLNDLWIPNVFIYNLKSFSSLQVLKRLAGRNIAFKAKICWQKHHKIFQEFGSLMGRMCSTISLPRSPSSVQWGLRGILWMNISASSEWAPPTWTSTTWGLEKLQSPMMRVAGTLF